MRAKVFAAMQYVVRAGRGVPGRGLSGRGVPGRGLVRRVGVVAAGLLLAVSAGAAKAQTSLAAYNVDIRQTTVSGLSAGAHMAHQMHVAYSDIVQGAALLAGGPYYCAQGSSTTAVYSCMLPNAFTLPSASQSLSAAQSYQSRGLVAPLANLAGDRVFLFSGSSDIIVQKPAMDAARSFYTGAGVPSGNIVYWDTFTETNGAGHTFPTTDRGGLCGTSVSPFISDCNLDVAGALLSHLMGPLNPRTASPGGQIIAFRQSDFRSNPETYSLATTGYVYVPTACAQGQRCRLHVAFHGCAQGAEFVGTRFVTDTGYLNWASTNNIIVLFPQTKARYNLFTGTVNLQGCWNWWGYGGDANYATRSGIQMAAIRAMIGRIGSGLR